MRWGESPSALVWRLGHKLRSPLGMGSASLRPPCEQPISSDLIGRSHFPPPSLGLRLDITLLCLLAMVGIGGHKTPLPAHQIRCVIKRSVLNQLPSSPSSRAPCVAQTCCQC